MESLQRDLVSKVLSHLLAKDLMRCKCVCKLWFDIITDPQFTSNYYVFYNSQEEQLLVIRTPNHSEETEISIISWNPNKPRVLVSSQVINHPYQYTASSNSNLFTCCFWKDIIRPCNGIYFLRGYPNVIMNPSLNQFKTLPESHFIASQGTRTFKNPHTHTHTHFPRFGFDPKTNDYKVVGLKQLYREETHELIEGDWAVELYIIPTLGETLMLMLSHFPLELLIMSEFFPYVSNCCHWLVSVYKSDGEVALSFYMVNELFRKIKVPKPITPQFCFCHRQLVPCSESTTIGVLHYYFVNQGTEEWLFFDVWVMKDYCNDGSWIKRYSFGRMPVIYRQLVGYYGSNQFIWEDADQKLVLNGLDFEERNRDPLVCGNHRVIGAVKYMESLVSLKRGMGF